VKENSGSAPTATTSVFSTLPTWGRTEAAVVDEEGTEDGHCWTPADVSVV